jgi:integrase
MASWNDGWSKTRYQGIWVKGNQTRIRVRTTDPKTGKRVEANRVFDDLELRSAPIKQAEMLAELTDESKEVKRTRFGDYSVSLYERKVINREIKSGKSKERWKGTLKHLIAAFGDHYMDAIERRDIETWKTEQAKKVNKGEYSPNTINGWLSILRTIFEAAVGDFEWERNPMSLVEDLDTSEHRTYTLEQPNSLTVEELGQFLAVFHRLYPQHFAFVYLGFATGQRPSHLRPLRRSGTEPDILWDRGLLFIRRSQTCKTVMNRTKTAKDQIIALPEDVVGVLRDHSATLDYHGGSAGRSELLFPSDVGGFHAASFLDRPFERVCAELGLTKRITPRGMRRTQQDIFRAGKVHDVVTRSISGHATQSMQLHYSTAQLEEQRQAIASVVALADYRRKVA